MGILPYFSANFLKVENFCDFVFVFLGDQTLHKRDLLLNLQLGKHILYIRDDPSIQYHIYLIMRL